MHSVPICRSRCIDFLCNTRCDLSYTCLNGGVHFPVALRPSPRRYELELTISPLLRGNGCSHRLNVSPSLCVDGEDVNLTSEVPQSFPEDHTSFLLPLVLCNTPERSLAGLSESKTGTRTKAALGHALVVQARESPCSWHRMGDQLTGDRRQAVLAGL